MQGSTDPPAGSHGIADGARSEEEVICLLENTREVLGTWRQILMVLREEEVVSGGAGDAAWALQGHVSWAVSPPFHRASSSLG